MTRPCAKTEIRPASGDTRSRFDRLEEWHASLESMRGSCKAPEFHRRRRRQRVHRTRCTSGSQTSAMAISSHRLSMKAERAGAQLGTGLEIRGDQHPPCGHLRRFAAAAEDRARLPAHGFARDAHVVEHGFVGEDRCRTCDQGDPHAHPFAGPCCLRSRYRETLSIPCQAGWCRRPGRRRWTFPTSPARRWRVHARPRRANDMSSAAMQEPKRFESAGRGEQRFSHATAHLFG